MKSKRVVRTTALITALLGVASTTLVSATPEADAAPKAAAKAHTVKLVNIDKPLVPNELVRGDREFGGNGPRIESKVVLSVSSDRRSIVANVYFNARETKADWSETRGSWNRVVYRAPAGKQIDRILDGTTSVVTFISKPAGFQILGPSSDYLAFLQAFHQVAEAMILFGSPTAALHANTPEKRKLKELADKVKQGTAYLISQGNHVHVVAPPSGPVAAFAIVGDTGGDDISTDLDPKDDTRIESIKFKPLKVTFR